MRRCQPLLGTFVEISAPDDAGEAISAAFAVIRHVHERMSFHEETSDLARVRNCQPGDIVELDRETITVLRFAIELHHASDGLFDVGIGRELVRGGFLPRAGIPPLDSYPGDSGDLEIVDDIHLRCRRRLLVDLGGIAKGHAVDRAVETLIAHGCETGLVNAGGDLRLFGARSWPVRIRDADEQISEPINLSNCALATSANLQDRRHVRGQELSPHLDRARRPVLADHEISIVADRCIVADAMTKVAITDPDLAGRLLEPHNGRLLPRSPSRAAA